MTSQVALASAVRLKSAECASTAESAASESAASESAHALKLIELTAELTAESAAALWLLWGHVNEVDILRAGLLTSSLLLAASQTRAARLLGLTALWLWAALWLWWWTAHGLWWWRWWWATLLLWAALLLLLTTAFTRTAITHIIKLFSFLFFYIF